jgi:hypothetical protein
MHLQNERIPSEYILQRYTYSARQDVAFSRDVRNLKGKDGETRSYRQKMLLKKAMKVVHHASLSKAGNDKALDMMDELVGLLMRVEPDIGTGESCGTSAGDDIQVRMDHCRGDMFLPPVGRRQETNNYGINGLDV